MMTGRFGHIVGLAWMMAAFWGCGPSDNQAITSDMIHFDADGEGKRPILEMSDTVWRLGAIAEGTILEHTFSVTNAGDAPLVLADVSASCGCTIARDWPKSPLAPGASASIRVSYDSRGRSGEIDSEIAVVANTYPSTTKMKLVGRVLGPNDTQVILNK